MYEQDLEYEQTLLKGEHQHIINVDMYCNVYDI